MPVEVASRGAERVVVVGAGPAGLAAAHELSLHRVPTTVLEQQKLLGGIARTENFRGFRFDIGGHRFFTRHAEVEGLWHRLLGADLLRVERRSRILFRGSLFPYPLQFGDTLASVGPVEAVLIVLSYLRAQLSFLAPEGNYEQWLIRRFGRRLFEIFFRSYTEKLWGRPCQEIHVDWAAQRVKNLSLAEAIVNTVSGAQRVPSLIDCFFYPRLGPGQLWQRMAEEIAANGGAIKLETAVSALHVENGRIVGVGCRSATGPETLKVDHVISTMPLPQLVRALEPAAPDEVLQAASQFAHRSLVEVVLIVNQPQLFDDQWIYIPSSAVKVGRIQNFKNWSTELVPDLGQSSLGLEYFCDEGDDLWRSDDQALCDLAGRELQALGLGQQSDVIDSVVVRQPAAYPVYDPDYERRRGIVRDHLAGIGNLQTVGRNAMHWYNNMDQSMLVGLVAARNVMGQRRDLWRATTDKSNLEEAAAAVRERQERVLDQTLARLDSVAFGMAAGAVAGLALFIATIWLVVKGGPVVGPNLSLISNYFWGYTVSVRGAFVALGYGSFWGFVLGWLFVQVRNRTLAWRLRRLKRRAALLAQRDFFDG